VLLSCFLTLSCLVAQISAKNPAPAKTAATVALPPALQAQLQSSVGRAMAGRSGAAVVIEVNSGEIVAQYHLDVAARRLARPGSAIKPFTLLAMLESGTISADSRLLCRRSVRVGAHHLDCTHPEVPAPFDAIEAVAYSCNYWFTQNAARLSGPALRDALLQAGLASLTGAASNEASGQVQEATTLEQRQLQAIGEYGVQVTPLELLWAYRGLAQKRNAGQSDGPLASVFAGLEASTRYGMAQCANVSGAAVAGKTGTAMADEGSWTHGWFAGYAPAHHPEIALVVFLERGRGPVDAATIAAQVFSTYALTRAGTIRTEPMRPNP